MLRSEYYQYYFWFDFLLILIFDTFPIWFNKKWQTFSYQIFVEHLLNARYSAKW